MLSVTPEAAQYIKTRSLAVYLALPPSVEGCCFPLQEAPSVKLGEPPNPAAYTKHNIEGIALYVPADIRQIPLTVTLSSFLGFKKLIVEGWQLV